MDLKSREDQKVFARARFTYHTTLVTSVTVKSPNMSLV